jgi:hypothetical protein
MLPSQKFDLQNTELVQPFGHKSISVEKSQFIHFILSFSDEQGGACCE